MESSTGADLHADMPQCPAARTEMRTSTENGGNKSYRESTPPADMSDVQALALQHALFTHSEEQHTHLPLPVLSTEPTSPISAHFPPLSSPTLGKEGRNNARKAGVVLDELPSWGLGGRVSKQSPTSSRGGEGKGRGTQCPSTYPSEASDPRGCTNLQDQESNRRRYTAAGTGELLQVSVSEYSTATDSTEL